MRTSDPRFPYFWRMVDDRGEMLTYSSARYSSREACMAAVHFVQQEAASSLVLDLTGGET